MRRLFFVPLALLCLVPAAVHADPAGAARKAIQAQYDKANAAAARRDVDAVFAIQTPDYVHIDKQGRTHTAAEARQQFAQIVAAAKTIKAVTRIQTFKLDKTGATVTIAERADIYLLNPQTGKLSHLLITDMARDLWVKTANGWKQKRTKELSSSILMDGKPVPQQPKPEAQSGPHLNPQYSPA